MSNCWKSHAAAQLHKELCFNEPASQTSDLKTIINLCCTNRVINLQLLVPVKTRECQCLITDVRNFLNK